MISKIILIVGILNIVAAQLIDLGHVLTEDTPVYPLPKFIENNFRLNKLEAGHILSGKWIAYNSFSTIEHIGTHIDAPYHINEYRWKVEEIPVEHFIAQAVVINVTEKAANNPQYAISAQDVKDWIAKYGLFPNHSIVLGNTGWSKRYNNATAYLGSKTDVSKLVSPGFDADAVEEINNYKNTHGIHVVAYGIDTISLDPGNSRDIPAHRVATGANQYIIENMNNLDLLPPIGATIIVMPTKIKGGTGGPARVVAQLPYNSYVKQVIPRVNNPLYIPCNCH